MKKLALVLSLLIAQASYCQTVFGQIPLREDTASQLVMIGPFLDPADGTAEGGLTIDAADVRINKNGAGDVAKNSGGCTHDANGMYVCTFDATDTSTVGYFQVSVAETGAVIVRQNFLVVEEAVFDACCAAAAAPLTATAVWAAGTRTLTAIDEDDTTLDLNGSTVGTVSTVTNGVTLANGAVSAAAIATDAIDADSIAAAAIGASEIATDAIGAAEIASAAIAADEIATDAIGAAEVATDAIGAAEIAASAITNSELASDGSEFTAIDLPNQTMDITGTLSTVTTVGTVNALGNDAIAAADIANGAIDAATFAADVDAEVLSYIVDDATRIDASELNADVDSLTFTVAGEVDSNTESMNGTEIVGDGSSGDKFAGNP